jgi:hypothetical protein
MRRGAPVWLSKVETEISVAMQVFYKGFLL